MFTLLPIKYTYIHTSTVTTVKGLLSVKPNFDFLSMLWFSLCHRKWINLLGLIGFFVCYRSYIETVVAKSLHKYSH